MQINSLEPLFESLERYTITSVELLKLKAVQKTADMLSIVVTQLVVILLVVMSLLMFSVSMSLWIGHMLGENYLGFLVVAAFYGVLVLVTFWVHEVVKNRIASSCIINLLK